MTLLDEILALPVELRATHDTQQIANALPDRVTVVYTEVGKGLVIETIGLEVGNALLDAIDANAEFRHIKHLLEQGRLDMGSLLARTTLDNLVGGVTEFTQAHADAIKALAERSEPVSEFEVRKLCWSDDGQWTA